MYTCSFICQHCKVTALCTVAAGEHIPDFTVVYGDNQRREQKPGLEELRRSTHEKQLEVLKKLIPSNLAKYSDGNTSGKS